MKTLAALSLIEDKLGTDSQFKGLSTKQAETVARETRRIERETKKPHLAREVGKRLAAGMRKSREGVDRGGGLRNLRDVTIHTARSVANDMVGRARVPKAKVPPTSESAMSDDPARDEDDLRGKTPESWLCADCGVNTAPGLLDRAKLEEAFKEQEAVEQTIDNWRRSGVRRETGKE